MTRLKRFAIYVAALAAFLTLGGPLQAMPFTQIVSFGDSLSDVGNILAATTASPIHTPDPPPFLGYVNGRATNGANWVDYLADDLGIARNTPSAAGGLNFAHAGASTGGGTYTRTSPTFLPNPPLPNQPRVGTQIDQYLSLNGAFTPGQLVTLWAGANDLRDATSPADIAAIVANVEAHIRTLSGNGASHILLPNQADLGLAPFFDLGLVPTSAQQASQATQLLNFLMSQRITALMQDPAISAALIPVDIFDVTTQIAADPAAFGFTNIDDPALNPFTGGLNGAPDDFLFWDIIHPTTAAHRLIADAALAQVVSAPGTAVLMGFAMISIGALRRRTRPRDILHA